jgi:hypothetical protein
MAERKKNKMVLVKVSDLNDQELDAAIDKALDTLFGVEKEAEPIRTSKPKSGKTSTQKPRTTPTRKKRSK